MQDHDIPVKTEKGLAEIKTRALKLSPRVRTTLLLVDGEKSVADLKLMMAAAGADPESLEALASLNLVRFLPPRPRKTSAAKA
jgi:hypothetical protein